LRRFILACGLLLAFAGMATAAAAAVGSGNTNLSTTSTSSTVTVTTSSNETARPRAAKRAVTYWSRHVQRFRAGTRRWLAVIHGRPVVHVARSRSLAAHSVLRLRRLARIWRHREHAAWWRANHPPDFAGWLCIHHYEGSWTDAGGPYWGGLQMNLSFQATYGGWLLRHKGTADHWSPLEQIWVAVRASRSRGFSPWPNTARYCGMI
jgi:hypothetical protein